MNKTEWSIWIYCFSRTDGAASAESNLFELCRVVTEEDEVNESIFGEAKDTNKNKFIIFFSLYTRGFVFWHTLCKVKGVTIH